MGLVLGLLVCLLDLFVVCFSRLVRAWVLLLCESVRSWMVVYGAFGGLWSEPGLYFFVSRYFFGWRFSRLILHLGGGNVSGPISSLPDCPFDRQWRLFFSTLPPIPSSFKFLSRLLYFSLLVVSICVCMLQPCSRLLSLTTFRFTSFVWFAEILPNQFFL